MQVEGYNINVENGGSGVPSMGIEVSDSSRDGAQRGIFKRKRPTLVCFNCKKKKIKCDRQEPCGQCVKIGAEGFCRFDVRPTKKAPVSNSVKMPYVASAKNPLDFNIGGGQNRRNSDRSHTSDRESKDSTEMASEELLTLKERLLQVEDMLRRFENKGQSVANNISPTTDASTVSSSNSDSMFEDGTHKNMGVASSRTASTRSKSDPNEYLYTNVSLVGFNPYASEEEATNFHEGYSPLHVMSPIFKINFGPLAWASLIKKDPSSRLLYNFISKVKKEMGTETVYNRSTQEVDPEKTKLLASTNTSTESTFEKRALRTDGYDDVVPYDELIKERKERREKRERGMTENLSGIKNVPPGFSLFDQKVDEEMRLFDKIRFFLPNRYATWKYIDLFFSWMYPFMPFIDYTCFVDIMTSIIGPKSSKREPIAHIKIKNRVDCASAGLLLVILRLSYLAILGKGSESNKPNTPPTQAPPFVDDLPELIANPIHVNAIEVAQECLDQFKLWRKPNFISFQLMLYLNLYSMYAPEEGNEADGGSFSFVNAVLVQTAISLGLNREPDNFPEDKSDPKMNNLGRKIWYFLVCSDVYHAYSSGSPFMICDDVYDTKLPYVQDGNHNIEDKESDELINEGYFGCTETFLKARELVKLILKVKDNIKLSEVCRSLSETELFFYSKFGSFADCLFPQNGSGRVHIFTRNMRCKVFLGLSSLFISIYFHLFLFYENRDSQLGFFYVKKIFSMIGQIVPYYKRVLTSQEGLCDFTMNPSLVSFLHKSNLICISLIIRLNFKIHHSAAMSEHESRMRTDMEYRDVFIASCSLSRSVVMLIEELLGLISHLNDRYYYAWRVNKGHNYILKVITSESFYKMDHGSMSQYSIPKYSLRQLNHALVICNDVLNGLFDGSNSPKEVPVHDDFIQKHYQQASMSDEVSHSRMTSSLTRPNTEQGTVQSKVSDSDIDKLWMQAMLNKKDNEKKGICDAGIQEDIYGGYENGDSNIAQDSFQTTGHVDTPPFNFSIEDSLYNIFDELPIKDLFNL